MKQIVAFLLFSFFPKLFPGETFCGKNYLHFSSNIYSIKSDIELYLGNIITEIPQQNKERNSSTQLQIIKSGGEDSEFNMPSNTMCATVVFRNYSASYFGWSVEQLNTCGPSEKTKCGNIIERDMTTWIVIEDCFNYMCTKDGCTAKFIVKKSYANHQFIVWSVLLIMFILVAALKKNGKLDVYDY